VPYRRGRAGEMIDLRFNRVLFFALRQTFNYRGFSGNLELFNKASNTTGSRYSCIGLLDRG
jgi:hypothetical protein